MQWDVFCRVIDNYGDIGVCWRLCRDLATRGEQVRLWVDDASALRWMAPDAAAQPGVKVLPWPTTPPAQGEASLCWPEPGEVVVEAFGCELPAEFIQRMATRFHEITWINLEYLTAEPFAARCHGLPSPVMQGPGQGGVKHFFYPGFTPDTGGLLREPGRSPLPCGFDRHQWLSQLGAPAEADPAAAAHAAGNAAKGRGRADAGDEDSPGEDTRGEKWVSLFCYEPAGLPLLLRQLASSPCRTRLLVTPGRAAASVQDLLNKNDIYGISDNNSLLSISYLPALSQTDFDALLNACDLNFVRGEDSLVRALWAGKPLVWHIYPQHDDAHHAKLQAFLDMLEASPKLRQWHTAWNGLDTKAQPLLDGLWCDATVAVARQRLLQQEDLTTQLRAFVKQVRTADSAKDKPPGNTAAAAA